MRVPRNAFGAAFAAALLAFACSHHAQSLRLTASPVSPVTINLSRIAGDTDISVVDTSVVINSSNWRASS